MHSETSAEHRGEFSDSEERIDLIIHRQYTHTVNKEAVQSDYQAQIAYTIYKICYCELRSEILIENRS